MKFTPVFINCLHSGEYLLFQQITRKFWDIQTKEKLSLKLLLFKYGNKLRIDGMYVSYPAFRPNTVNFYKFFV